MSASRIRAFVVAFGLAAAPAGAQLATAPAIAPESVTIFSKSGTASVSGRVVAHLPGDRVRFFDKWQVFLVPVIPYTFYFEHLVIDAWKNDGGQVPEPDPRFTKLVRATLTNADGYFRFSNLSKGSYFVYSVVEVKDGRQETQVSSSFEQTGTQTILEDGVPVGEVPSFGYVEHPYLHDYTCDTQGVVGGAVAVGDGEAAKVDLGLYGERNDGC